MTSRSPLFLGALLCGALLTSACADSATTAPNARIPNAPSFALDLTPPAAPADLSAAVVAHDTTAFGVVRALVQVTWTDNVTATDEFNTCAWGQRADGTSVGGGCVYASDYDTPPGSTGTRSGQIIVGTDVATVHARTTRRFQQEILPGTFAWRNVSSELTAPVAVSPLATFTNTTKKGKK